MTGRGKIDGRNFFVFSQVRHCCHGNSLHGSPDCNNNSNNDDDHKTKSGRLGVSPASLGHLLSNRPLTTT